MRSQHGYQVVLVCALCECQWRNQVLHGTAHSLAQCYRYRFPHCTRGKECSRSWVQGHEDFYESQFAAASAGEIDHDAWAIKKLQESGRVNCYCQLSQNPGTKLLSVMPVHKPRYLVHLDMAVPWVNMIRCQTVTASQSGSGIPIDMDTV